MDINDGYHKIMTDETLRETIQHGSVEYPFRYYREDIWQFDFHCIDWHWHPEVEFVFVEKGRAEFLIGNQRYILNAGTGIFINTQVMHRFETTESTIIPNIVFSPELLAPKESLIYQKYIQPILHSSVDCCIFSPNIKWQEEILNTLLAVFTAQNSEGLCEIKTIEFLLKLWSVLYTNVSLTEHPPISESSALAQAKLQIMMQYIHKHYAEHITLEGIASTVFLSKSSTLNIFKKYLDTSPIDYLINYRLKRAAKLLTTTNNSVLAISQDTGFNNVGYFCRKFKELFKLTPSEYRKRN